jgi:anti-anti-sigma regulatory factor
VTEAGAVDDGTARTLIRMASSLRILGVSVIITGFQPEVAMAVAEMGLDMPEVEVRSTLEEGIELATARRDRG